MNAAAPPSLFGCLWCVHCEPDRVPQTSLLEDAAHEWGTCYHPHQFGRRVAVHRVTCGYFLPFVPDKPPAAPAREDYGPALPGEYWPP